MIYLLTKESTLHAADNKELIGALPVVNAEEIGFIVLDGSIYVNEGINGLKLFSGPGEVKALPGWKKVTVYQYFSSRLYYQNDANWTDCTFDQYESIRNGIPRSQTRQAYRLKRSEPLNVNQLKALDKGLERSELVKKEPIKLTFYSGKLWHSDKPFPVKPKIFHSANAFSAYAITVNTWLSTAYEVVNPEVLGIHPFANRAMDGSTVDVNGKVIQDGDELTLPEGYGIERDSYYVKDELRNAATITLPEKPEKSLRERIAEGECISERGTDHCPVCIDSCDAAHHKRNIEELIEKPENSAHSFTEGSDCGGDNIIVNPVVENFDQRITHAANVIIFLAEFIHGINCGKRPDLTLLDFKNACSHFNKLIEPSESQEETQADKWNVVLCWYFDLIKDGHSGKSAVDEIMEKFTITRK